MGFEFRLFFFEFYFFRPMAFLVHPIFSKNTPGSEYKIQTTFGNKIPDKFVDFGTSTTLMDVGVSFE